MVGVRAMVLVLLCTQNSLYTLLRRYSRGVLKESVSSSAVLLAAEVLKFALSAALVEGSGAAESDVDGPSADSAAKSDLQQWSTWLSERARAVHREVKSSCAMAVPAITYLIMNMLSFKAIALVDATVFAMIAQLKILSTAGFSFTVLGRRLSAQQWRAIYVLTLAVTIITYQRGAVAACGAKGAGGVGVSVSSSYLLGVCMVLLEISLSGWISAYFEKHLKDGQSSVWGRNLQLSFWSILIYSAIEVYQMVVLAPQVETPTLPPDGDLKVLIAEDEMNMHSSVFSMLLSALRLWSPVTIMLVILGGGGGLLVAFAIKHADAVMKSMATSFSLIIVVIAEMLFLGVPADPVVCLACGVALLGLQLYQDAPKVDQSKSLQTSSPAAVEEGRSPSGDFLCTNPSTSRSVSKQNISEHSVSCRSASKV